MTPRVALHHLTRYRFDRPVTLGPHEIRLRPAAHAKTPILDYSLKANPGRHRIRWHQDVHGNFVARLEFHQPLDELLLSVDFVVDLLTINPFDFVTESWSAHFPFRYPPPLRADLAPFLTREPGATHLQAWLLESRARLPERLATTDLLVTLNRLIHREIAYQTRWRPGTQSCEETLSLRSGSCRDSAWLLIQTLRHMGVAARFVSGYLIQLVSQESTPTEGSPPQEEDSLALHAWCEAYLPGAGWIGLDTTSGLLATESHIPVAVSASPQAAAPVSGTVEACESQLEFAMRVTRWQ